MPKEPLEILPFRASVEMRQTLDMLARMNGMTTSELVRWILARALYQEEDATADALGKLTVARFGPATARRFYEEELQRQEALKRGAAAETPDAPEKVRA